MSDQPDRDEVPEVDRSGRGPLRTKVFESMADGADWRRQERGVRDEPVAVDR